MLEQMMYDDHRKKGILVPTEKEFRGYYALLKLDKHPGYKFDPSINDNIGETEGEIGGHVFSAIDMPSLRCYLYFSFFLNFNVK
ncbi:uncharacterized protein LOC107612112 isoform X1 [Arachis ipaensis]|uniref:uncharacterized protein LOC107612112 isoform X1 n=1 Tax=Arachis ipaensis TaxID=130454 RepID=UPI000A2B1946|nr:uncharacterized protein LOC107612112 isoform X1 [Arachis ipaensis]